MKNSRIIGNGTRLVTVGDLKYIQFECLDQFEDKLIHCMSTRLGGVSENECSTLNLGFNRRDTRKNVETNFKIICNEVGIDCETLVFSNQIHDNKIKVVGLDDKGKGFNKDSDIKGFDGLITNISGITLVTFYADCVPVLLYDHNTHTAALLHSGWRSTLKGIAKEAVIMMTERLDCKPDNIIAAIGPSISKCCFEVSEDVYLMFYDKYMNPDFYEDIGAGKWKIDLQGIIESDLLTNGILKQNITVSNVCTKCNNDLFFSHRGDYGKTGSLAAFMQLQG